MATQFFASEYGQELLDRVEKRLKGVSDPKSERLKEAVHIIKANGKVFDEGAAWNVDWIGKSIAREVDALEKEDPPGEIRSRSSRCTQGIRDWFQFRGAAQGFR